MPSRAATASNRCRIFADWILFGAGKDVYQIYLMRQHGTRNDLRAQAAELRAQAYLLDLAADS